MSSVPQSIEPSIERDAFGYPVDLAAAVAGAARRAAAAVSFWLAIALPAAYLPLLAGGLSGSEAVLFVGLLAANAVALLGGHGHEPASPAGE